MNINDRIQNDGPSFCPLCGSPVSKSIDDDGSRLCELCGWFGDLSEVLNKPMLSEDFNPVLGAAQGLELFRGQCRRELALELAFDAGLILESDLKLAKTYVRNSTHELITMFTKIYEHGKGQEDTDEEMLS